MITQKGKSWNWKRKQKYGFREFHAYYRSQIDKGSIYDIDYKLYSKILQEGNKLYTAALMRGRVIRPLPGLGEFQVHKYVNNSKRKPVDWGAWYNKGIYRYLDNDHSGGYRFFVKWTKFRGLQNITYYKFEMILYAKRALFQAVMNGLDAPIHDPNRKTRRHKYELYQRKRNFRKSQE